MKIMAFLVSFLMFLGPALSDKHQRKQLINFDQMEISGDLSHPDGLWVAVRRERKLGKLFVHRENFKDKIQKGVEELDGISFRLSGHRNHWLESKGSRGARGGIGNRRSKAH